MTVQELPFGVAGPLARDEVVEGKSLAGMTGWEPPFGVAVGVLWRDEVVEGKSPAGMTCLGTAFGVAVGVLWHGMKL